MLKAVGFSVLLLSFFQVLNGPGQFFLHLQAVILRLLLVFEDAIVYLVVRLVLVLFEISEFRQDRRMPFELILALSDPFVMGSELFIMFINFLLVLLVEGRVLLIELYSGLVDLLVQVHRRLSKLAALLPQLPDVVFVLANTLLGLRLV